MLQFEFSEAHALIGPSGPVVAAAFSPSGDRLCLGTEAGQLLVYDVSASAPGTSSSPIFFITEPFNDLAVTAVAWSCQASAAEARPKARLYAAAGHTVFTVDLRDSGPSVAPRPIPGGAEDDEINGLSCTRKGLVAAASDSGKVFLLEEPSENPVRRRGGAAASGASSAAAPPPPPLTIRKTLTAGHENIVSCLTFRRAKPSELLSGGLDSRLVRWEHASGRAQQAWGPETLAYKDPSAELEVGGTVAMTPPMVQCLADNPSTDPALGSLVAAGLADGSVSLVDVDVSSKARLLRRGGTGGSGGDPASRTLATGTDGFVGSLGAEAGGHRSGVTGLAFLGPSGRLLVSGGSDRRILVWALESAGAPGEPGLRGTVVGQLQGRSKINALAAIEGVDRFAVAVGRQRGAEIRWLMPRDVPTARGTAGGSETAAATAHAQPQ